MAHNIGREIAASEMAPVTVMEGSTSRKRKEREEGEDGVADDGRGPAAAESKCAEGDEGEAVVTLSEVIQEDTELNEAADAVLGDCSETNCSYPMGYFRQALYACLTCTPPSSNVPAGVCLACSYNCHADHELVELYTKRHFQCDCGNSKFPTDNPCKLVSEKAAVNEQNKYSQNFFGKYCTCHRPYPDPERTTEEVMIQCIICEDWLHHEHIAWQAKDDSDSVDAGPEPDSYDEMVCAACVAKHPFLLAYVGVETDDPSDESGKAPMQALPEGKEASEEKECVLASKEHLIDASKARALFWPREWRDSLCECADCMRRYEREEVTFLLDPEDSLVVYEERAKENRKASMEEAAEKAFQTGLSHEQQIEMAHGYNHMKQSLQQYLAAFAEQGKTVKAEDIKAFFEDLRQTKRQRTDEGRASGK